MSHSEGTLPAEVLTVSLEGISATKGLNKVRNSLIQKVWLSGSALPDPLAPPVYPTDNSELKIQQDRATLGFRMHRTVVMHIFIVLDYVNSFRK